MNVYALPKFAAYIFCFPGCLSAGPHYNPHNKTHAGPNDEVRCVSEGEMVLLNVKLEGSKILTNMALKNLRGHFFFAS